MWGHYTQLSIAAEDVVRRQVAGPQERLAEQVRGEEEAGGEAVGWRDMSEATPAGCGHRAAAGGETFGSAPRSAGGGQRGRARGPRSECRVSSMPRWHRASGQQHEGYREATGGRLNGVCGAVMGKVRPADAVEERTEERRRDTHRGLSFSGSSWDRRVSVGVPGVRGPQRACS